MKRDVDLIRQLLFDIERQGAECSLDALRNAAAQDIDERLRFHVRLLIDAGLAKETDRTSAGQPCLRLTNAGCELLDLCRDDARWREAKWIVQDETGGTSLTVLRAVLTKWAVEGISRSDHRAPPEGWSGGARRRRWRRAHRPYYDRVYYRGEPVYREPGYRVESYRYEREPLFDDEPVRVMRPRREYRDAVGPAERWEHDAARVEEVLADEPLGVSLPVHMI
jgi:hypothetical protein